MNLFGSLIYYLSEHIISFLILFFIIFTVIIFLFVKKNTVFFFYGILKSLLSLIISPIFYLKKTVSKLTDYQKIDIDSNLNSNQYLLQKVITLFESILIIVSVAIFVNGIIIGFYSFLPPEYLRRQITMLENEVNEIQTKLNDITPEYERITNYWESKKDSIINSIIGEKSNQNKILLEKNEKLYRNITNDQELKNIFDKLLYYYFDKTYYYAADIEISKTYALNYLDSDYSSLNANKINLLKDYINNWAIITTNNLELNNLTENTIRRKIQPNFQQIETEYKLLSEKLQDTKKVLNNYQENVHYNFEALFLSIFYYFLLSLIFIWIFGLIIELLNISIDIANNIRIIKELKEKETPKIS